MTLGMGRARSWSVPAMFPEAWSAWVNEGATVLVLALENRHYPHPLRPGQRMLRRVHLAVEGLVSPNSAVKLSMGDVSATPTEVDLVSSMSMPETRTCSVDLVADAVGDLQIELAGTATDMHVIVEYELEAEGA
jgi:hypothetical protein